MRYLRMLTNAAIAGALAAAFLGVLILQLNPQLPLSWAVVWRLGRVLLLFYGANLAVAFYALIVVRQLFASVVLSPGWISMRLLAWLGTMVCAGAAWLMSQNLELFAQVLSPEAARRMALGMWATAACAAVLLGIAVLHYSSQRPRASAVGATLFALTQAAALVLPLTARGQGGVAGLPPLSEAAVPMSATTSPPGRLRLVLLDGASLDLISVATAEGRLPNFGRILDAGVSMHLTTVRPTQPAPVWAAATTGKFPPANGVRSAAAYEFGAPGARIELLPDLCFAHALVHLGLLRERSLTAEALRARPLWQMLTAFGIPSGVVGVPLTQPAQPVLGYVVSDRTHLVANTLMPVDDRGLVFPGDAFSWAVPGPLDPVTGALPAGGDARAASAAVAPHLLAGELSPRDTWYRRVHLMLDSRYSPAVSIVRYDGLDQAGHLFLRQGMPSAFGDVSEEERRRFGQVLDRQYAAMDAELGRVLAGLGADDVLMVVSGFGIAPVSVPKRLLARLMGEQAHSGSHESAPDGFLLAYGASVARGRLPVGSVTDVAPTVLYALGLPVARDMAGSARTDVFNDAFRARRPVSYIPTYR